MQTQSHTLIADPSHTLPNMMVHIPIHTPSCVDDDDAFLPDLSPDLAQTETEPATATPVHAERTLSAAEIQADLAESAVVSGHGESAQSLNLQLEVSINSKWQTKEEAKEDEEVDVVNTQEVDMENTQYEDHRSRSDCQWCAEYQANGNPSFQLVDEEAGGYISEH